MRNFIDRSCVSFHSHHSISGIVKAVVSATDGGGGAGAAVSMKEMEGALCTMDGIVSLVAEGRTFSQCCSLLVSLVLYSGQSSFTIVGSGPTGILSPVVDWKNSTSSDSGSLVLIPSLSEMGEMAVRQEEESLSEKV